MKVSCQSMADFYKIHQEKGKAYTYNNFKTSGYSKAGIYKIMSKFDEMGNVDHKSGGSRPLKRDQKIKSANQNGLDSLLT